MIPFICNNINFDRVAPHSCQWVAEIYTEDKHTAENIKRLTKYIIYAYYVPCICCVAEADGLVKAGANRIPSYAGVILVFCFYLSRELLVVDIFVLYVVIPIGLNLIKQLNIYVQFCEV